MSTGASVALIIGSVVTLAAAWILLTRRSGPLAPFRRSTVEWLRPTGHRMAHAFPTVELRAELTEIAALGHCGRWPIDDLVRDDGAVRCAPCERAVERMEHRHR
jgi:hypothetical protein